MPIAEYYLLNKRITPIIRVGYIWEFSKIDNVTSTYKSPVAGLGIAFMNKSGRFGVNIGADYYFNKSSYLGGIRPNLSLNFYLNRKKKNKTILY